MTRPDLPLPPSHLKARQLMDFQNGRLTPPIPCLYRIHCTNEAVGTVSAPVAGDTPTCRRCANEAGIEFKPLEPRFSVKAFFVPQAWVSNHAVNVDPAGPTAWDATTAFWTLPEDYRIGLTAEIAEHGQTLDSRDLLAGDRNAPEWIRSWQGPFSIRIERADGEEKQ